MWLVLKVSVSGNVGKVVGIKESWANDCRYCGWHKKLFASHHVIMWLVLKITYMYTVGNVVGLKDVSAYCGR